MKFKKLLIATAFGPALALTATGAAANGGLYGGVSLDWVDASAEFSTSISNQEGMSANGVGGTLYFGYEHAIPGGYVGLEGNVGQSAAEYKEKVGSDAASMTRELSY